MNRLIIVADNIRSIENTGAIFRVADGVGAQKVVLVGITPYPDLGESDSRRPWLRHKMSTKLKKTALDGMSTEFAYFANVEETLEYLRQLKCILVAVEQTATSVALSQLTKVLQEHMRNDPCKTIVIILGNETEGVSQAFLEASDLKIEIPMYGKGKSLNVAVAAGIAAYAVRDIMVCAANHRCMSI